VGNFITDRHNNLFKEKIDILRSDLAKDPVYVYLDETSIYCEWCYYDESTGRSSGKAKKDWSTHPVYDGIDLVCPSCNGVGRIVIDTIIEIPDVIIEDVSGIEMERGTYGVFPMGTLSLIGKYANLFSEDQSNNYYTLVRDGNIRYLYLNSTYNGYTLRSTPLTGAVETEAYEIINLVTGGVSLYIYLNSTYNGLAFSTTFPTWAVSTPSVKTYLTLIRDNNVRKLAVNTTNTGVSVKSFESRTEYFTVDPLKNYFYIAKKIVIDGMDYRLLSFSKLGLKDWYLFEAIVQRTDLIEN